MNTPKPTLYLMLLLCAVMNNFSYVTSYQATTDTTNPGFKPVFVTEDSNATAFPWHKQSIYGSLGVGPLLASLNLQ